MGMTETATKLIKRFGQAAVLRKPGEPGGTPWAPTPGVPTEHAVTVAVTNFTLEERATLGIPETDMRVFMAVSDVVPSSADTLVIGGTDYSIYRIATLGPDGVTICFDLQVRS